ncbi:SDR family oxidoreductase [Polynucleobacter necessarius]|uniref:SDR family oxidoreductase n=1 Tax=Polynucleobacter necessarius TaxID=576610 RepID=UPI000E09C645|nr:SDR family oxidoreductase [Polynucleobacter necessarius]
MNPSSNNPSLQEKAVLVTGAAKRLGRDMALQFARQGWNVAIHYGRSEEAALETLAQIQALGVRSQAFRANLADEEAVQELFSAVTKEFNLECLVNSASIFEYDRASSQDPLIATNLQKHMQVNLTAPMLLSQLMFTYLKNKRNVTAKDGLEIVPSVIQLLDQKLINPNPDYLSYTLSKAALASSVELLAMDFAPYLRVVGLAPGISLPSGDQTNDGFSKAHQMTPLGKSSTPDDIAKAAVFLAESSAITGTTLYVDGGQHLLPSSRDVMFKTN